MNWALVASAVNTKRGTLRGLHFQYPSAMEAKLVRCTRGSLWDIIVDLREGSPTRYQWHAEELSRKNGLALYIPTGFGHGYLSLEDDSEAEYLLSAQYSAELANGLRWNDPALGIDWPFPPMVVSERDQSWPYLRVEP